LRQAHKSGGVILKQLIRFSWNNKSNKMLK
jgi:hypothetical protein